MYRKKYVLTISFRPFYLPREFGQITVIFTYVPGPNVDAAGESIAESFNNALARSTDQPVLILGDFNSCDLSEYLPTLQQYVDCPTRLIRTIDRCYGNITNAYKAVCRPPLGKSNHNVIHLLPKDSAAVKTAKPVIKQIHVWSDRCKERLKDCFEETNWDSFFQSCQDVSVSETKTVNFFPNNKTWVSRPL